MRKLLFALTAATILFAASSSWKTEATPLLGAGTSLDGLRSYSLVEKTGCVFGTSRCPAGTKWACAKTPATAGAVKKCLCRPC
jgi:hypothetical protein